MANKLQEYAGVGMEQVTDSKIPYLKIAQEGMTAELNKQKTEYIKGLEAGMLFCSTTKKIYGNTLEVVVLATNKSYMFFEGKNWKGSTITFNPKWFRDPVNGTLMTEEGWKVTTCYNYLVVPVEELEGEKMVLTLKNSDSPTARDWNTKIKGQLFPDKTQKPLFGTVWKLQTQYREDENGKGWFGLGNGKVANITALGDLPDKYIEKAAELFQIEQAQNTAISTVVNNSNAHSTDY